MMFGDGEGDISRSSWGYALWRVLLSLTTPTSCVLGVADASVMVEVRDEQRSGVSLFSARTENS
jgi:hypothetical protein